MRFAATSILCALGWLQAQGADGSPTVAGSGEGGHYAAVHGLRMYYEVHGAGPAVLVLHGGMSSIPVWPTAIEYFSKAYEVVAPEQMGHGRTADDMSRPMDYHAMAEDTAELLRQLKIARVYVLGHSDGAIVGLDLAIHHPDLVIKLAAAGADIDHPPAPKPGEHVTTAADIPVFIREPYERISPDGPAHWPILFARVLRMWQTQPNFTDGELKGIAAPTLIIAGDRDFEPPEYVVAMWRKIPGAELWIAANSTHGLPVRRAALFNEVVDTFFKEAPPAH